jgi:hypothetical protein
VNASLFSSERPDWNTPQRIIDVVRDVAGGDIGCDPCSNEGSKVGARVEYRLDRNQNGLELPWSSLTYVNPPYGREIGQWTRRCLEVAKHDGVEVVALVPARVDARWFRDCWEAAAICFVYGRLRFLGAPASAPFPSALVYWGTWRNRFACAVNEAALGRVIEP